MDGLKVSALSWVVSPLCLEDVVSQTLRKRNCSSQAPNSSFPSAVMGWAAKYVASVSCCKIQIQETEPLELHVSLSLLLLLLQLSCSGIVNPKSNSGLFLYFHC